MTALIDLDDAVALAAADVDGLLFNAARAGAQLRAIAELAQLSTERLGTLRPRAVVFVVDDPAAREAAQLVLALAGNRVDVPLVVADELPQWVGPLDVVVIAGLNAGSRIILEALKKSMRRHAVVTVAVPIEGPVKELFDDVSQLDFSPKVFVNQQFSIFHFIAVFVQILQSLTAVRGTSELPELMDCAAELDAAAELNHLNQESFHNSAKALAHKVISNNVIFVGATTATVLLAQHAARQALALTGKALGAGNLVDALIAPKSPVDSIFFDPFLDQSTSENLSVQIISAPRLVDRMQLLAQPLGNYEFVSFTQVADSGDTHYLAPGIGWPSLGLEGISEVSDIPADLTSLLVILARLHFSLCFVRLLDSKRG